MARINPSIESVNVPYQDAVILPQPTSVITTTDLQNTVYQILGNSTQRIKLNSNWMQSANFVSGSSGWMLDSNGNLEANDGNFRGSITGANGVFAGTISANNVTAGTLTGSTVIAKGTGSGNDVRMNGSTGNLEFLYGGAVRSEISADSYYNLLYIANTSHQFFDQSNHQLAAFSYTSGAQLLLITGGIGFSTAGTALTWADGRSITESSSDFRVDGDWNPKSDKSNSLGYSTLRWSNIYGKNIIPGDISFTDKYCPFCEQELKVGDGLINYLYKQVNDKTGFYNSTIPAHLECYMNKDSFNKTDEDLHTFIQAKSDAMDAEILTKSEQFNAQKVSA